MALTCDLCLNGDSWRCKGPPCANAAGSNQEPSTQPSDFTTGQKRNHRRPYDPKKAIARDAEPMVPRGRRTKKETSVKTSGKKPKTVPKPMKSAIRNALTEGVSQASVKKRLSGRQSPSLAMIENLT